MLRRERELLFLGPDGRVSRFRAGVGPAPFRSGRQFSRGQFSTPGDKLRVVYGWPFWRHGAMTGRESRSPTGSLRHRQSLRSINLFWAPVLVSALNERLDQMDVGHARKVFLDGFLRNRTGFQPEYPVPLGELYGAGLEAGSPTTMSRSV